MTGRPHEVMVRVTMSIADVTVRKDMRSSEAGVPGAVAEAMRSAVAPLREAGFDIADATFVVKIVRVRG